MWTSHKCPLLLTLSCSLGELLQDDDPDTFCQLCENSQRCLLRGKLGNVSELVERVIESIKKGKSVSMIVLGCVKTLSLFTKLLCCRRCRQTRGWYLSTHCAVRITSSPTATCWCSAPILRRFSEKHSFTRFVAENSTEVELVDDAEFATKFNSIYEMFAASFKSKIQWGVGLKEKEAARVPLLCDFVVSLVSALQVQFPQHAFAYAMEFVLITIQQRGPNPAVDTALVFEESEGEFVPLILFEYKPIVDLRLLDVNARDLLQVYTDVSLLLPPPLQPHYTCCVFDGFRSMVLYQDYPSVHSAATIDCNSVGEMCEA